MCCEGLLFAVAGAGAVGGVSSHIVGSIGIQAGDAAGERACAAAVSGVRTAYRRVLAGAPAHAAGSDGSSSVRGDVAAAGGSVLCHIGDIVSDYRWCQTVDSHGDIGSSRATVLVRAGHGVGGCGGRVERDRSGCSDRGVTVLPHIVAGSGSGKGCALAVVDGGVASDGDVHLVAGGCEGLLFAVAGAGAVGGVSPHIVGGIGI